MEDHVPSQDRMLQPVPPGRPASLRLLTVEEILTLEDPEWLIDGMVEVGAQGVIYGPSGEGKSFVALDWALSVATGREWQGHATKKGPVLYVVAEGGRGIKKRIAAWKQNHGVTMLPDAYFVLEAVQLRERSDYERLVGGIDSKNLRPSFIVLDTFARCFVGGDENASKDVGTFIEQMHRLHDLTGASILLVHHTGKKGDTERGSSALRAAADVMFKVSQPSEGVVQIENDKQKDEEESPKIRLRLEQVAIEGHPGLTSCVLRAVDAEGTSRRQSAAAAQLTFSQQVVFAALRDLGQSTSGNWHKAVGSMGEPLSQTTFHRRRRELLEKGVVLREGRSYRVASSDVPSANGTPRNVRDKRQEDPSECASHATPPMGVAGRHESDTKHKESVLASLLSVSQQLERRSDADDQHWLEYERLDAAVRGTL